MESILDFNNRYSAIDNHQFSDSRCGFWKAIDECRLMIVEC